MVLPSSMARVWLAIDWSRLSQLGKLGWLSSIPPAPQLPLGQPRYVFMAIAEVQERRQTRLIIQAPFKLLLTSHLPRSHWPEQVPLPSPESEKGDIADDMAKGVDTKKIKIWGHCCNLPYWPWTSYSLLLEPLFLRFLTGSHLLCRVPESIQEDKLCGTLAKAKVFFLLT